MKLRQNRPLRLLSALLPLAALVAALGFTPAAAHAQADSTNSAPPAYTVSTVSSAYTLTTLAEFDGSAIGASPKSIVVLDKHSNLYGTTSAGGTNDKGTIFKIDGRTHALTTLVNFDGINGAEPSGALAIDRHGNVYGTTKEEHAPDSRYNPRVHPLGTVFKVDTSDDSFTTLVTFRIDSLTGIYPEGVTLDKHDNLFGITQGSPFGFSTVYKIALDTNTFTTVARLGKDSANQYNELGTYAAPGIAVDDAGNLYGTDPRSSKGSLVFEIRAGTDTAISLGQPNRFERGVNSLGYLLVDPKGDLYGTMGTTVFKIPAGTSNPVTLASFRRDSFVRSNLGSADAGVVMDGKGNLFGTTTDGGMNVVTVGTAIHSDPDDVRVSAVNRGTVFEVVTGTGEVKVLVTFDGPNGAGPGGLTLDGKGNLYGTTSEGGKYDKGTVFKLTPNRL